MSNEIDRPKSGERWYVALMNASCLTKIELIRITDKTVSLKKVDTFSDEIVYRRNDVEFIIKI